MFEGLAPPKRQAILAAVDAERARRRRLRDERAACEASLAEFVRGAWGAIDSAPYVDGFHIDSICQHLEAVTRGEIKRLVVNIPPRMSKTTLCSICWPAWTWARSELGPRSGPQVSFLCASYNDRLSLDISVKMRRLIESRWYQELWGDRFSLMGDQNTKTQYDNDRGGSRIATSVGGSLLGLGGQVIVVDDPHNTEDVESDAGRRSAIEWWDSDMSTTRLNDPKEGAIVVIMQRLHEDDLTGHILATDAGGWDHLMLPMSYDPARHCRTSLGWEDPRQEDGELLCPERIGQVEVARNARLMGPYKVAGRYQQAPVPRGGGIIRREWWQPWPTAEMQEAIEARLGPDAEPRYTPKYPAWDFVVAALDTAQGEKETNDYNALTVWGIWSAATSRALTPSSRLTPAALEIDELGGVRLAEDERRKAMMIYAWRRRLPLHGPPDEAPAGVSQREWEGPRYLAERQKGWGLVEWTVWICRRYKVDVLVIEDKTRGKDVAQELRRLYADEDWGVHLAGVVGDKVARANALQHLWSNGVIYAPLLLEHGEWGYPQWAETAIDEFTGFPMAKHDDQVDACLAPETGVVTARGLVPISEVNTGDLVFTHKGRWRPVVAIGSRHADHYYRLKAKGLDEIRITGDHPALVMNVSASFREAPFKRSRGVRWAAVDTLTPRATKEFIRKGRIVKTVMRAKHDCLVLPRARSGALWRIDLHDFWPDAAVDDTTISLERRHPHKLDRQAVAEIMALRGQQTQIAIGKSYDVSNAVISMIHRGERPGPRIDITGRYVDLDEDAGWAMGLFAAEGSVTRGRISWACDKAAVERVARWVERVFLRTPAVREESGCHKFGLVCLAAVPLFAQFGRYAQNKIVPPWAITAPEEFIRGFVEGFAHGDGYRTVGKVSLTSTSRSLLWGIRLMLARLGRPACNGVTKPGGIRRPFGRDAFCLPAYRMDYCEGRQGTATVDDDYVGTHIEKCERVEGTLVVHNLSVAEDESYVTVGGTVHNCLHALKYLRDQGLLLRRNEQDERASEALKPKRAPGRLYDT